MLLSQLPLETSTLLVLQVDYNVNFLETIATRVRNVLKYPESIAGKLATV